MTSRNHNEWWTEHLVEAPADWLQEQSGLFGIPRDSRSNEPVPICELRRLLKRLLGKEWIEITPIGPPLPDPILERIPVLRHPEGLVHLISAKSLDHLKELAGIPNGTILAAQRIAPGTASSFSLSHSFEGEGLSALAAHATICGSRMAPRSVEFRHLPVTDRIVWEQLSSDQRTAVQNQAYNLVFGYADAVAIKQRPISTVVDHVLQRARRLPVFTAKDLIVCDEEQVVFSGFSALWFDNVIIEGSGQITLGQYTKLHSYNIKRVPL
jgi:hypothetical protein